MKCCCLSDKKKQKKTSVDKKKDPRAAEHVVAGAEREDWREGSWKEDIQRIWEREIEKLPVHIDLPRLCKKVILIQNGEVIHDLMNNPNHSLNAPIPKLPSSSQSEDVNNMYNNPSNSEHHEPRDDQVLSPRTELNRQVTQTLLLLLKTMLNIFDNNNNTNEEGEEVNEDVNNVNNPTTKKRKMIGTSQGELESLLDELHNTHLRDCHDIPQGLEYILVTLRNTHTESILRCCHQKVIFPAYYLLKSHIHHILPFKDRRASWYIIIELNTSQNNTIVRHRKSQEDSQNTTAQFSFEWELELRFDLEVTELQNLRVTITNWEIHDESLSQQQRDLIANTLGSFSTD